MPLKKTKPPKEQKQKKLAARGLHLPTRDSPFLNFARQHNHAISRAQARKPTGCRLLASSATAASWPVLFAFSPRLNAGESNCSEKDGVTSRPQPSACSVMVESRLRSCGRLAPPSLLSFLFWLGGDVWVGPWARVGSPGLRALLLPPLSRSLSRPALSLCSLSLAHLPLASARSAAAPAASLSSWRATPAKLPNHDIFLSKNIHLSQKNA